MPKKREAEQILNNGLLTELLEDYDTALYRRWRKTADTEEARQLHGQANAVQDIHNHIRRRCEEIVGEGND